MYTRDSQVAVYPFTRQMDGNEVIVGRLDTGVFLALPSEAVEVLDYLAQGKTVGQAEDHYREQYGEIPDLEDFLSLLESKGLIQPGRSAALDVWGHQTPSGSGSDTGGRIRYHFVNFPQALAARLFSRLTLAMAAVLIGIALWMIASDPSLVPGRSALYFPEHRTLFATLLVLLSYLTLFIHEMGHLVAGRAVGVNARLGISHRLWVLVAETDLTALWSVPKRQRYLPLLAGSLLDSVSAAILILLLAAYKHSWLPMPTGVIRMVQAMTFVYLMRLLWQCFFFVRTDFYYVISTLLNCKSLLADTENYLRNKLSRWIRAVRPVDQSGVPSGEMRVIRGYSLIWLLGRILALALLVFITIPVGVRYFHALLATIKAGYSSDPYAFVDALVIACFSLVPLTIGSTLWIASLARRWRKHS